MGRKDITTRVATGKDNVLLAEFGRRTFYENYAQDNTPEDMAAYLAENFSPEIQAGLLGDETYTFVIAEIEGEMAGYVELHITDYPDCVRGVRPMELERIYADTKRQGQGVGSTLMLAALDTARVKGCDVVWLSVWKVNEKAIAFYERWGYEKAGTEGFMLGSDLQWDWIMTRKV